MRLCGSILNLDLHKSIESLHTITQKTYGRQDLWLEQRTLTLMYLINLTQQNTWQQGHQTFQYRVLQTDLVQRHTTLMKTALIKLQMAQQLQYKLLLHQEI